MAHQWEYLDRLRESEDALVAELRRHPLSITAQINLAHIRKMRRKFEPANDGMSGGCHRHLYLYTAKRYYRGCQRDRPPQVPQNAILRNVLRNVSQKREYYPKVWIIRAVIYTIARGN